MGQLTGISAIVLLLAICGAQVAESSKRVCYYTNWAQYRPGRGKFTPENIDGSLCSHLIYAFATMVGNKLAPSEWNDESTKWSKGMYEKFNDIKKTHPSVKTLLAVGGWKFGTSRMTAMLSTPANRAEFVSSTIKFLRDRNFDGLNLAFLYPGSRGSPWADKEKFALLCKELRAAFEAEAKSSGKPRLLLTAAVSAGKDFIDRGYDIPSLSKSLDFANLLSYDFHSAIDGMTGLNSPLIGGVYRNVKWAANYWTSEGFQKNKLVIGMPTYGRTYTLSDPSKNGIVAGSSGKGTAGIYTREAGSLSYYEICEMLNAGATRVRIPGYVVPYLYRWNQWVSYDDPYSLQKKLDWVNQEGYGGWMVWTLDMDDFNGQSCGAGNYPLLKTLNGAGDGVTTGATTANGQTTTTPPATTTTTGAFSVIEDPNFCVGKANKFYRHQSLCNKYIWCVNNYTYYKWCPTGLHFDVVLQVCNWPFAANCPYS